MRSAEKLGKAMRLGRVYRRHELARFSKAVDRDLRRLLESGEVRKLAGGLYYRPQRNAFGHAPPADEELVRAFLKTDSFLLTSYNHFNQLGLGLTQVHNHCVVYNHKRTGDFALGGKRYTFRIVPDYPAKLSKEFLLVDLLRNLRKLPDDTSAVFRNLKHRLDEFDRGTLRACLERYGNPAARRALQDVLA